MTSRNLEGNDLKPEKTALECLYFDWKKLSENYQTAADNHELDLRWICEAIVFSNAEPAILLKQGVQLY